MLPNQDTQKNTSTTMGVRRPCFRPNAANDSFYHAAINAAKTRTYRAAVTAGLTDMKATVTGTQGIGAVYVEEVRRHMGVDAAHVYGGLLATLTAWCEHHQIPYQGVPVGTIKKHATGRGNASKDEMIAAMRALGHAVTDDNEADALAILHWAIAQNDAGDAL